MHGLYKFCAQPFHHSFLINLSVKDWFSPLCTAPTITIKEYIKE